MCCACVVYKIVAFRVVVAAAAAVAAFVAPADAIAGPRRAPPSTFHKVPAPPRFPRHFLPLPLHLPRPQPQPQPQQLAVVVGGAASPPALLLPQSWSKQLTFINSQEG